MRCPECNALLEEGLLPVSEGMHWVRGRTLGGAGGGGFAENVPGTHAVMRPNRMEAWRCKKCHLILFRYGESWDVSKKVQMLDTEQEPGEETETDAGE
jgi:uncharacterized protein with PIN domain